MLLMQHYLLVYRNYIGMVQYGEDALTIKKVLAMMEKNEEASEADGHDSEEHSDNEQNHT